MSTHDQWVLYYARNLIRNGWTTVRSHLPGKIKPPTIGGHIPDIYAQYLGQEIVIEVEIKGTANTAHAQLQHTAFRLWARASPATRKFFIKTH